MSFRALEPDAVLLELNKCELTSLENIFIAAEKTLYDYPHYYPKYDYQGTIIMISELRRVFNLQND
jgi:hypothetical protein